MDGKQVPDPHDEVKTGCPGQAFRLTRSGGARLPPGLNRLSAPDKQQKASLNQLNLLVPTKSLRHVLSSNSLKQCCCFS